MRLINTTTLQLHEFADDRTPEYAILSHRWRDKEVLFDDVRSGTGKDKAGWNKIVQCCRTARDSKTEYVWIDTCCIDKSSSAELSESINSMYRWYRNAIVCYAYLDDVHCKDVSENESFAQSEWFTRGWTLQELLAPQVLEFYNYEWHRVGTRRSLASVVAETTGIHRGAMYRRDLSGYSVAQRMSWASERKTTRIEDLAYSMLGLLDVNMPLLYGEGEKAFTRLQEEVMKASDDQSIFAWTFSEDKPHGLLAQSPSAFRGSGANHRNIESWNRTPYSVTNIGLSIELPLLPWAMDIYLAPLDCASSKSRYDRMGIFLAKLPGDKQFARVLVDGKSFIEFPENRKRDVHYTQMYVRSSETLKRYLMPIKKLYGFWIRQLPPLDETLDAASEKSDVVKCDNIWDPKDRLLKIPEGECGSAGSLTNDKRIVQYLEVGFDQDFQPWCKFKTEDMVAPETVVGDRLKGVYWENDQLTICIVRISEGIQRTWAVDVIEDDDASFARLWKGHRRYTGSMKFRCNGCGEEISGLRLERLEHRRRVFGKPHNPYYCVYCISEEAKAAQTDDRAQFGLVSKLCPNKVCLMCTEQVELLEGLPPTYAQRIRAATERW